MAIKQKVETMTEQVKQAEPKVQALSKLTSVVVYKPEGLHLAIFKEIKNSAELDELVLLTRLRAVIAEQTKVKFEEITLEDTLLVLTKAILEWFKHPSCVNPSLYYILTPLTTKGAVEERVPHRFKTLPQFVNSLTGRLLQSFIKEIYETNLTDVEGNIIIDLGG